MLKTRLAAAYTIRDTFLPLKKAGADLATMSARCVAVMKEQRAEAGVRIGTGAEALSAVQRAAALYQEAEQVLVDVHPKLAELVHEIGLKRHYAFGAYGDDDETPDGFTSADAAPHLEVVARDAA